MRYVRYFEQILKGKILAPTLKTLKSVEMHTVPNMGNKRCKPYLEIIQVKNMTTLFSGKKLSKLNKYIATKTKDKNSPRSESHLFVKGSLIESSDKSSVNEEE